MAKSIAQATDALQRFQERLVRGTLIDLGSRIILDTPVRTGRLRGNWNISLNYVSEDSSENTNMALPMANLIRETNKLEIGELFYMSNNLVYAMPIEFGHSKRHPRGMLRVNVRKFAEAIRAAAMRASR